MAARNAKVILHLAGAADPDELATIVVDVVEVRQDGTNALNAEQLADALVELAIAIVDPSKRPTR